MVAQSALLTAGCCDECKPDMAFVLPLPPSDEAVPLTVAFSRSRDADARVSCAWTPGADSEQGAWSCEPRPKTIKRLTDIGRIEFAYAFDGAGGWVVQTRGPAGTADLDKQARSEDPGEGWPGSCPCYGDELTVYDDDFDAVRFPPPEFGQPCTSPSDCGSDLACGPGDASITYCAYNCFNHPCFAGSTCENGWCSRPPSARRQ